MVAERGVENGVYVVFVVVAGAFNRVDSHQSRCGVYFLVCCPVEIQHSKSDVVVYGRVVGVESHGVAQQSVCGVDVAGLFLRYGLHKRIFRLPLVGDRRLSCKHRQYHRRKADCKKNISCCFFHFVCLKIVYFTPVCPKPPAPRSLSERESAVCQTTVECRATTIWQMRSPGLTTNGSFDRLARITPISPR